MKYSIAGDTVLNSLTWHKVYDYNYLLGAMREDSLRQVYFYNMTTAISSTNYIDSVYKLYDFSIQEIGDTVKPWASSLYYHWGSMIVTDIDSVLIYDQYRKRYHFGSEMWIEGIGSTTDLFRGMRPMLTCGCGGYDLICYKENSITYYLSPSYSFFQCDNFPMSIAENKLYEISMSTYPNPFSTQTTLHSGVPLNNASIKLYDSFGRYVRHIDHISGESIVIQREGLTQGIYILKVMQNEQLLKTEKLIVTEDKF